MAHRGQPSLLITSLRLHALFTFHLMCPPKEENTVAGRNLKQPPGMVLKPSKSWDDKLPVPQLVSEKSDFRNHHPPGTCKGAVQKHQIPSPGPQLSWTVGWIPRDRWMIPEVWDLGGQTSIRPYWRPIGVLKKK